MRERAPLGMLLFLLNEAVLFFLLIAAYVYFHNAAATAARTLNLGPASAFTACLAASSFTMWRGAATGARGPVTVTFGLGVIFLLGQGAEYWRLFHRNITIANTQFGTTFFTLTGIHGLHVLVGLVLLLLVSSGGALRPALQSVAFYWYFVDAVWIAIFVVVYLGTLL